MLDFIQDDEIRKDMETLESSPNIKIKREIAQKYDCPPEESSKWQSIYNHILKYLRKIRCNKVSFTKDDIHDFFQLTNYVGRYDQLRPFLLQESQNFIEYLKEFEYEQLLSDGFKQYTLDNIVNIPISNDITYGSPSRRFKLERFKSIVKYYEDTYGKNKENAANTKKLLNWLSNKLFEETYENRLMLEQNLEDFINECYDIYVYNGPEHRKIKNLITHYQDLQYDIKDTLDDAEKNTNPTVLKYGKYINALQLLSNVYSYFKKEKEINLYYTPPTKEARIESSLEYFNQKFNKLINDVINKLVKVGVTIGDNLEVHELKKADQGYYFTIEYKASGVIYLNFIILHEYTDTSDMNRFVQNQHRINRINNLVVAYNMGMSSSKILLSGLDESFDFNSI